MKGTVRADGMRDRPDATCSDSVPPLNNTFTPALASFILSCLGAALKMPPSSSLNIVSYGLCRYNSCVLHPANVKSKIIPITTIINL